MARRAANHSQPGDAAAPGLATRAPRYQQLTELLAREIGEGRYPVGSLLPPEPQLCQRFAVSRHTVREAVRQLCEQGLVTRHQGVGTRVRASRSQKRYVASLSSLGDLMAYAQRTRLRYLGSRRVDADAALAQLLRCQPGEQWLEVDTCRYPVEGGLAIVHMRVYVRPHCEGMQHALEDGDAWIYGLVERYGGERILEAQQVVGAIAVPAESARILGVASGSPGLFVRRYYLGRDDRLLSVSLNVYPVDRFEFSTRWRLAEPEPEPGRAAVAAAVPGND
jgi:GntR family transcriptional regulator